MIDLQAFPARKLASAAAMTSLIALLIPWASAQQTQTVIPPTNSTYEVLFTVPKGGATGVTYVYENAEEMLPSGPRRLIVADDGSFLILDSGANRILRYSHVGDYLNTITVPNVELFDVLIYQHQLYAIGTTNGTTNLYQLSPEGFVIATQQVTLPQSKGMQVFNTLKVNADGDLVLEITDSDLRSTVDVPLVTSTVTAPAVELAPTGNRTAEVKLNGQTVDTIDFHTNVHNIQLFARQDDGAFEVQVTEVMADPAIRVDAVVRSYASNGTLLGMVRSPASENYINVPEPVTVSFDGSLYGMITEQEGAKIVQLPLQASVEPVLSEPEMAQPATPDSTPAPAVSAKKQGIVKTITVALAGVWESLFGAAVKEISTTVVAAGPTCGTSSYPWRSRSAMASQAKEYINNWKLHTMSNMDPSRSRCSDRAVPDQFVGATSSRNIPSVAYKWGGFDLPSSFNSAMSAGQIAGNAKAGFTSCANSYQIRGVDCSGFVSRTWSVGQHTTSSLPNISIQINTFSLSTGDILNYAGKHVRLVDRIDGNGAYVWESTVDTPAFGYGRFDGALYRYYSWNHFFNYIPYKYKCVQ